MNLVRATPFHMRAADANRLNAWSVRNGWTLATHYGDPHDEALAARLSVAVADISWRWRVAIEGPRVEEFLARLLTRDAAKLSPGCAFKALWLTDQGGLRGAGLVARTGEQSFLLASAAPDMEWVASAAALFDVHVREAEEGGLALVGPYASKLVAAAGLDANLEPLAFRKQNWDGLDVTLSRWGQHGGYELWCNADDAPIVWDRIARAGEAFALSPAGLEAMDIIDLEAGVPRPGRDYDPAAEPSPRLLGLESLIDPEHRIFNGRAAYLAAPTKRVLAGVEFDSDTPAPFAPLFRAGLIVGQTLGSLYSPALRRAIALAQLDAGASEPGCELTLRLAPDLRIVTVRVTALPFLPTPVQISP